MTPLSRNIKQSIIGALLIVAAAVYALIGIAHPPEGTTITNEAISSYLYKTGQRMIVRSNTTETVVQSSSVAAFLDLNLSVNAMVGNGVDSCRVVATVLDAAGNPVPDGQPVEFVTTAGAFSNSNDTTYTLTVNGNAVAWLHSVNLLSRQPVTARISASTLGASGQSLTRFLPILFYAGGVRGKIVSAQGRSVQGMIVVAYTPLREEAGRDTTESDGKFIIPLTQSGTYSIAFRYKSAFGDDITVFANTAVNVPSSGGVEAVAPLNTMVGNVTDILSGQPLRVAEVQVMLYRTSANPMNEGRTLPALQTTDERGVFAFDSLVAGSYEMHVMDIRYSGKAAAQHPDAGTFFIDADIQLVDSPSMEVVKTSNKRTVEIGDAVTYTIDVRNVSASSTLLGVRIMDELPKGFVFASGSARSDSVLLPNPDDKRRLEWLLADSLPPGSSKSITYSVLVGTGALDGDGVNKAFAVASDGSGQTLRSVDASVQVTVTPGVFTDRGIVLGKIFYDTNENGQQDDGEKGIPGVELWMEDGTRIITGDEGKYSLPEVRPGQHVLRVNDLTLPYGSELLALKSESAGDGISRFVRLTEGGIARTDFYVKAPHQASLEASFERSLAQLPGEEIQGLYTINLFDIGSPTRVMLTDTLPAGFAFDYQSIAWHGTKLYPEGARSRVLSIEFPKRPNFSSDSIRVVIIGDSNAAGKTLGSNGKLLLGYPRGRDARFAAVQNYGPVEPTIQQPITIVEEKQTESVDTSRAETIQSTASREDTVVKHVAAPVQEKKRSVAVTRKKSVKQPAMQKAPLADSTKTQAPEKTPTPGLTSRLEPPTELPTQSERSRITELLGYESGKDLLDQREFMLKSAAGLMGSLVVLYLLFLLLVKRRKKDEEERQ